MGVGDEFTMFLFLKAGPDLIRQQNQKIGPGVEHKYRQQYAKRGDVEQ
jgi:hypothetical protein